MIFFGNIIMGIAVVLNDILQFIIFLAIAEIIIVLVNADPGNLLVRLIRQTMEPILRPLQWKFRSVLGANPPLWAAPLAVLGAGLLLMVMGIVPIFRIARLMGAGIVFSPSLVGILSFALDVFGLLIIASVVLSWLGASPFNPFVSMIRSTVEPVLKPIRRYSRRFVPNGLPLDFSPYIAILLLHMARFAVVGNIDWLVGLIIR